MVEIEGGHQINTIVMGNGPPLVLFHGWGGGLGVWVANMDDMSQYFTLYICDLLGFGRSSRPKFTGTTCEEGEWFFLSSMKSWIDKLGLRKATFLGHSFGGYLSALFAIQWPDHVEKLILADPWGVPKIPFDPEKERSLRWRAVSTLVRLVGSPFTLLKAAGPMGLSLMTKVRPDLFAKLQGHLTDGVFQSYVYHANVQESSGDAAFFACQIPGAWAQKPLVERMNLLRRDIPVFCVYGKETWMDYTTMRGLLQSMPNKSEIVLLPAAGHQVFLDNFIDFNRAVCQAILDGSMQELIDEYEIHQVFESGCR